MLENFLITFLLAISVLNLSQFSIHPRTKWMSFVVGFSTLLLAVSRLVKVPYEY